MLTIRFNRVGKRNRAQFRIALQEKTVAPGKRHVELLGSYDPHLKKAVLNKDRILYWIGQGVELSDTVHNLLVKEGVVEGKKRSLKIEQPKKEEVKEEAKASEPVALKGAPKEEKVAEEALVATQAPAEAPAEVVSQEETKPVA